MFKVWLQRGGPGWGITLLLSGLLLSGGAVGEPLRDPTQPPQPERPAPAEPAPLDMTLDSILTSNDRRVAVINGEAVREGDRIGNAQIRRIGEDRVLLRINQTNRTLTLDDTPSVRQP